MDPYDLKNEDELEWKIIEDALNDLQAQEACIQLIIEEHLQQVDGSSSNCRRQRSHIERNREEGHVRLWNDYFSTNPVYTEEQFRRRYRMRKHVFLRIVEAISNTDDYFQMRNDATGRMGLSPLQKCTAAIRMLAYGSSADSVDEYVRIGESTARECMARFVKGINEVFGPAYLRKPNNRDIARLMELGKARGFPGMLGSIDCMHWIWKNCPTAWKGQYCRGDHGKPTIILEAVASQDLWIWHAFFGVAGSNNDINVLNQSDVFNEVLQGKAPEVQFTLNGTTYNMGYYLADGIYPEWATFVKTISMPQGEKRKLFAQHQEGARKDVERAFGVLQSRFATVRGPARAWHLHILKDIIYACIILHNMIVEDEREMYDGNIDFSYDQLENDASTPEVFSGPHPDFAMYLRKRAQVREKAVHRHLQADLVEHVWEHFSREDNHN
ncbi:uncharacterized protein LOC130724877 [Lotus japonicus]|uniref:uncharacterized protein LOC130724877 n=1 Tax=Lotus japonicus TaxID=34305 RepID=UPI0025870EC2|nr:uncharacterized protein LOC130724877 [Lotus japonicus]